MNIRKCARTGAGGLIWVSEWNALQHPVSSAFLAVLYSDYMVATHTPSISCDGTRFMAAHIREFAISQVKYIIYVLFDGKRNLG